MVVREVFPGHPRRAVVLADAPPGPFTQVRPQRFQYLRRVRSSSRRASSLVIPMELGASAYLWLAVSCEVPDRSRSAADRRPAKCAGFCRRSDGLAFREIHFVTTIVTSCEENKPPSCASARMT